MTHHRAGSRLCAAAGLALGLALALPPGAAQAQVFGGWGGWDNGGGWDGLPPQQVRRSIAARGFRVMAPLRRNGQVYVADVVDPRGQHERLIVAAADGQILQRFLVDDGRGAPGAFPRRADEGADDGDGLVPPADIPNVRRLPLRPAERDTAPPRFGDAGGDDPAVLPVAPDAPGRRDVPAIRTVKPRPRVVERTPEPPAQGREPGPVEGTPLAPVAPRAAAPTVVPLAPAPVARAPAPAAVASRPEPAPQPAPVAKAPAPAAVASQPTPPPAPTSPTASAAGSRRMTDPLAIPGGDAKPVRNVAAGITGTPAAAPPPAAPAAKPGDVPAAPLD